MNQNSNAINTIAEQVVNVVKVMIDDAKYNKTVKGVVQSCLGNNCYTVMIAGEIYSITSNIALNIGDIVSVVVCNNDYSNLMVYSPMNNIVQNNTSVTFEDKFLIL